jgi:hypothetical protein
LGHSQRSRDAGYPQPETVHPKGTFSVPILELWWESTFTQRGLYSDATYDLPRIPYFHALFVNKEGKGPQGLARLSGIGRSRGGGRSRSRGRIWGRSRDGLLDSRLDGLLNRHGTRRRRSRGGLLSITTDEPDQEDSEDESNNHPHTQRHRSSLPDLRGWGLCPSCRHLSKATTVAGMAGRCLDVLQAGVANFRVR